MLRFLTAGESHGPELVAIVEGVPAGFEIEPDRINEDLARRQKGYGRGGRMAIERDEVRIVSGVRFGRTLGSPITLIIENKDFKNWQKRMSIDPAGSRPRDPVTRPRPGHADLAGVLKYNLDDIRDILERASARETTARVAVGALARQILDPFGIEVLGYVVSIGAIEAKVPGDVERRGVAPADRRIASAGGRRRGRARYDRRDRCLQEDRRYSRRSGRSGGARLAGWTGQPRSLGSKARRPSRGRAAQPAIGQGRRDRALGFAPPRCGVRPCTTRSATTRPAAASPAYPTTPAGARAE